MKDAEVLGQLPRLMRWLELHCLGQGKVQDKEVGFPVEGVQQTVGVMTKFGLQRFGQRRMKENFLVLMVLQTVGMMTTIGPSMGWTEEDEEKLSSHVGTADCGSDEIVVAWMGWAGEGNGWVCICGTT